MCNKPINDYPGPPEMASVPVTGIVFEIREFTLQDGPGIRTSVFLKGCPLRCHWCHNPEGQSSRPELLVRRNLCEHCGACVSVCPTQAEPEMCHVCGKCTNVCPQNARTLCGTVYSDIELVEKLLRSRDLYALSGGGVTLTGGDPVGQIDFARSVAIRLRQAGIHVAIETSGYTEMDSYKKLVQSVDLVYQDIKIMDADRHRHWTGCDNGLILQNIEWLQTCGIPYFIRVPLIPGVNDSTSDLADIACFLHPTSTLQAVELLPYNSAAGVKYPFLNREYSLDYLMQSPVMTEKNGPNTVDPRCLPFMERSLPVRIY